MFTQFNRLKNFFKKIFFDNLSIKPNKTHQMVMSQAEDSINKSLKQKFKSGLKWNIFGSLSYEGLRILNLFLLLKVLTRTEYGLMGSFFSIVYLAIYFSDFSNAASLPPFLQVFTQSKQNFKKLLPQYLAPQILLQILAAIIVTVLYAKSIFNHQNSPFLFILPAMIIMEGLRIFFRSLLHYLFHNKKVMLTELVITLCYYSTIWLFYFFYKKMSLNIVFIPYLADTMLALIVFFYLTHKEYKRLPNTKLQIPENLYRRMFRTRIYNFATQMSKNFFTGNFLIPVFAVQFGLQKAGILRLSANIADSLKALIKVTIGFSGNALLAKIKQETLKIKQQAFTILSQNLNKLIYFSAIFLTINYTSLLKLKVNIYSVAQTTLFFSFIFLLITLTEYFFIVYEQFYILEEKAFKLMLFKLLEFVIFYIFVIARQPIPPVTTLMTALTTQIISFAIIATSAYRKWRIRPRFRINFLSLISYSAASIAFYLFLNL